MFVLALGQDAHRVPIAYHVSQLLGSTPAFQLALHRQRFVTGFEGLRVDQFNRPPSGGVCATQAQIVLLHSLVQIVGIADVKAAIGARQDVEEEIHVGLRWVGWFVWKSRWALRLRRCAATLRANGGIPTSPVAGDAALSPTPLALSVGPTGRSRKADTERGKPQPPVRAPRASSGRVRSTRTAPESCPRRSLRCPCAG